MFEAGRTCNGNTGRSFVICHLGLHMLATHGESHVAPLRKWYQEGI